VDFLLVLIELFSLDAAAEALRAIIGSKSAISIQRGPVDPKFQVEEIRYQPFFLSKNRLMVFMVFIYIYGLIFLPFCHNSRV